jgi:hypothetical protein
VAGSSEDPHRREASGGRTRPARAVLDLDGVLLRRFQAGDLEFLVSVHASGVNSMLLELPGSNQELQNFIHTMLTEPWSLPMIIEHDGIPIGAAATGLTNYKSLLAYVVVLLAEPVAGSLPIAMYVRHMFWNFPLNRLYTHVPLVEGTEAYVDSFQAAGFRHEGVMPEHLVVGARQTDVAVLGLLRRDFEVWSETSQPRLNL